MPPIPATANSYIIYCRTSFNEEAYRLEMKAGEKQTVVAIRDDGGNESLTFTPTGPLTEQVGPPVGLNGEVAIAFKRVYIDNQGKRWLYSSIDAHISLVSSDNQNIAFLCYP